MSSNLIYSPSAARVLNAIPSNEHTAGDRTPYCYLIGWTEQNLWYYGRRTAEGCHPSEFWKKYFTSCGASNNSKIQTVHTCRRDYGEPDVLKICKVFTSVYECVSWETKFLTKVNAAKNPIFLNRTNGDTRFDATGRVSVMDQFGNTMSVSVDDELYLSGELIPASTGYVSMQDALTGESVYVEVDDPRINVTLFHHALGMVYAKKSQGEGIYCSITDERYTSGEYKHTLQTGIQLISPLGEMLVYPRDKEDLYPGYKRNLEGTVFVKDSNGTVLRVSTTDQRFLSGELKALTSDRVTVVDDTGKIFTVSCDEYTMYKGIKYKSHFTNTLTVKDKEGNFYRVSKDDPRYLSGELVFLVSGMTTVIDTKTGKRTKARIDDERILTGEFIKSNYDKDKHDGRIDSMRKMCDRQEVKDLRSRAEELGVKLPMNWEKRKDLSVIWKLLDYPI